MTEQRFRQIVRDFYRSHGRGDLPWRATNDPYRIAVSELMLQQTQVSRVIGKYRSFLKKFPTLRSLARAPLREVLSEWSGLGYNRRAKYLKLMSEEIVLRHGGKFPRTIPELEALSGIGAYTARAIAAFAYNEPSACIETNIRTVFIHHFFKDRSDVSDKELLPIIERTLDRENPREWYWALMDYGSHLKSQGIRTHRASAHYVRQSAFEGSKRQIRGAILKLLVDGPKTAAYFFKVIDREKNDIETVLTDLTEERLITEMKGKYLL